MYRQVPHWKSSGCILPIPWECFVLIVKLMFNSFVVWTQISAEGSPYSLDSHLPFGVKFLRFSPTLCHKTSFNLFYGVGENRRNMGCPLPVSDMDPVGLLILWLTSKSSPEGIVPHPIVGCHMSRNLFCSGYHVALNLLFPLSWQL